MSTPFARAAVRVVPLCFVLGAGIEWFMVRVRIGSETFCEFFFFFFVLHHHCNFILFSRTYGRHFKIKKNDIKQQTHHAPSYSLAASPDRQPTQTIPRSVLRPRSVPRRSRKQHPNHLRRATPSHPHHTSHAIQHVLGTLHRPHVPQPRIHACRRLPCPRLLQARPGSMRLPRQCMS